MTPLPQSRPLTRVDLDGLRDNGADDGHRYEIVDGVLVVTPSPSYAHQEVSSRLSTLLVQLGPTDLVVLYAPFDVALGDDTVMEPDLLVARRADFTHRDLPVAPLLAVEILSPSTRRFDLTLKRSRFEAAGVASYWVVDPTELTHRVGPRRRSLCRGRPRARRRDLLHHPTVPGRHRAGPPARVTWTSPWMPCSSCPGVGP